ncbi:MAG TPA: hypothetical protein VFS62_07400 [Chloroflexota bacterium]|nr:hypothetical protein [Chloroflexota bacterium]
MAKLVGLFNTAHSPFCFNPPERWSDVRGARRLRSDVPVDDLEVCRAKSARIQQAFGTLRQKIAEARPDVLIVFGDDQLENFNFNNFPTFAVYVGPEFEGTLTTTANVVYDPKAERPRVKMQGKPELAVNILTGLMKRGFDPAFSMDMPNPERGIGHAVMRPTQAVTDQNIPTIPVLLNCYYAPQVTAKRAAELGRAVRQVIDEYPEDLRVGVLGSGGLWHTPGAQDAWLNEDFDRKMLGHLADGDVRGMAETFDTYKVPEGDASQYIGERGRGTTGMPSPGGPQGGTRETCNWVAAAAVADGQPWTVVDYVPVYSSPVGAAFAYSGVSAS